MRLWNRSWKTDRKRLCYILIKFWKSETGFLKKVYLKQIIKNKNRETVEQVVWAPVTVGWAWSQCLQIWILWKPSEQCSKDFIFKISIDHVE